MNIRQTRFAMNVMSIALLVASGATAWWGLSPLPAADASQETSRRTETAETGSESHPVESVALGNHWQLSLRRPLIDPPPVEKRRPRPTPPPVKKAPVVRPAPSITITLVGTIMESGRDVGVFADTTGKVDLKSVGEVLDLEPGGVRVERISETTATLSLSGRETEVKLKKKKGGRNGKPRANGRPRGNGRPR